MGSFADKENKRKKPSVVSKAVDNLDNKPIKGQETIETLEGGRYMPNTSKAEEKATQSVTEPKAEEEVKKIGRPPENRETKKRVSLAVLPSVYDNIGKIAYVDRTSISEIASQLFEQYIAENMDKIKVYDSLKK